MTLTMKGIMRKFLCQGRGKVARSGSLRLRSLQPQSRQQQQQRQQATSTGFRSTNVYGSGFSTSSSSFKRFFSASVYGKSGSSSSSSSVGERVKEVEYVPIYHEITVDGTAAPSSRTILLELSPFRKEELTQGLELMNMEIATGNSWPFLECYDSLDDYCSYFHSHNSYAVRFADQEKHGKDLLGCFYIKPNFPGRCSHICNGGFITNKKYRKMGIGKFMAKSYLKMAKDLGYRASFFNLVFSCFEVYYGNFIGTLALP